MPGENELPYSMAPRCGGEICDFYATKSSFVLLSREIVLPLPQNSVATGVVNVSASTKSHDSQIVRNGTEVTEVSQFEASASMVLATFSKKGAG